MDFRVRNAFGHVPVTLCTKRRKFMDFDPKIARIHRKCRKMNAFESIARPGSVQNDVQKVLKHQNWRNRRWVRRSTLCYSTVTLRTVTLGTVTLGTVLNILEANVVYLDLCPSSSSYPSSNPCTFQQNIFYADSEPEPVPGLELVLGFISSQHIYQFVV